MHLPVSRRLAILGVVAVATVLAGGALLLGTTVPPARTAGRAATPMPTATAPISAGSQGASPSAPRPAFDGEVLIADRGNGRLLVVNRAGQTLWKFPGPNSLPKGRQFAADDAFFAPDGKTIVANDEDHQMVYRIDIATKAIVWSYGHYQQLGKAPGYLHTPDDAYPLPNGDVMVADIFNCRILEIRAPASVVRQWGQTGTCKDAAPRSYGDPNGDTPLSDGGVLITEITGSRVVRLDAAGDVVFDIHVPVHYPSDAHLDAKGNVLVVDYSKPGAIVDVSPTGQLLWRYAPASGPGMLDHPSLAIPLPDGTILLNDDFDNRVIQVDPTTNRIVWQYGHTGTAGTGTGYLNGPDGLDPVPPGVSFGAGQ